MEMPKNYEETQAAGNYPTIDLGGHYLVIKQVVESKTKNDDPMVVIYFDTAPNDTQPGFFSAIYKGDQRKDKKWPFSGTVYQVTEWDGQCTRNFKGFITSVERSNPGFKVKWGANFGEQFKGKLCGGNFGIELDVYQGNARENRKLQFFIPNDDVPTAKVPEPTETKKYKAWKQEQADVVASSYDDFSGTPFDEPDDMPFA